MRAILLHIDLSGIVIGLTGLGMIGLGGFVVLIAGLYGLYNSHVHDIPVKKQAAAPFLIFGLILMPLGGLPFLIIALTSSKVEDFLDNFFYLYLLVSLVLAVTAALAYNSRRIRN